MVCLSRRTAHGHTPHSFLLTAATRLVNRNPPRPALVQSVTPFNYILQILLTPSLSLLRVRSGLTPQIEAFRSLARSASLPPHLAPRPRWPLETSERRGGPGVRAPDLPRCVASPVPSSHSAVPYLRVPTCWGWVGWVAAPRRRSGAAVRGAEREPGKWELRRCLLRERAIWVWFRLFPPSFG